MSDKKNYSTFREDDKFTLPEWKWFERNDWTLNEDASRATKDGPGELTYSVIPWWVSPIHDEAYWVSCGKMHDDGTFEYETEVVGGQYQISIFHIEDVIEEHRKNFE